MLTIKQINNEKVKPIKLPKVDNDSIKGYNIIPDLYCNIFLCAKKRSGKTNVIFKILKDCTNKLTKVIIFASTIHKDANYGEIIKWMNRKKMDYELHTSVFEDGKNILSKILSEMGNPDDDEKEEKPKLKYIMFDDSDEDEYIYKPKKIAPEYLFIFDDVSTDLKNPIINNLLKTNRHYKSKVILSSQYPNDLMPEARKQIDIWIIFKGHSTDKLELIHKDMDTSVSFPKFYDIYKNAIEGQYNFLLYDKTTNMFRRNFNMQYLTNDN